MGKIQEEDAKETRTESAKSKANGSKDNSPSSPSILSNVINAGVNILHGVLRSDKPKSKPTTDTENKEPKPKTKISQPININNDHKNTGVSTVSSALYTGDKPSNLRVQIDPTHTQIIPKTTWTSTSPDGVIENTRPIPVNRTELQPRPIGAQAATFTSKSLPSTSPSTSSRTSSPLQVQIPSSPLSTSPLSISGSPRMRAPGYSPQLGMLQRRSSLRNSPLSLSSASIIPPDWDWQLEESRLQEERMKREEEQRVIEEKSKDNQTDHYKHKKLEVFDLSEQDLTENSSTDINETHEYVYEKDPEKQEDRLVFHQSSSPPTPSNLRKATEGTSPSSASPGGRFRLASSAFSSKV